MHYPSLSEFLSQSKAVLRAGPIGIVIAEDALEVASTLRHNIAHGIKTHLLLAAVPLSLPPDLAAKVHHIDCPQTGRTPLEDSLNPLIKAAPNGVWISYCYNAEYLHYPFRETRPLSELLAFCSQERRFAMACLRVDAYPQSVQTHPYGVDLQAPAIDGANYYALPRQDPFTGERKPHQFNLYGGLAWRFADMIPAHAQRLDRIAIFQKVPHLRLREDHTFNLETHNTLEAEWHHSPTAALVSFRLSKALRRSPATRPFTKDYLWQGSVPFTGTSRQLMDLGLIEPGQWF